MQFVVCRFYDDTPDGTPLAQWAVFVRGEWHQPMFMTDKLRKAQKWAERNSIGIVQWRKYAEWGWEPIYDPKGYLGA